MSTISRAWKVQHRLWTWTLIIITTLLFAATYHVNGSRVRYYDKTKESRRGAIRKAKEGKSNLLVKQERFGVTRSIYIEDNYDLRRQFFLEADKAEGGATVNGKNSDFKERFTKPKGWLQEELFWELNGSRVIPKGHYWVWEANPTKRVNEKEYGNIVPMQHLRFFDAQTGDWSPDANKLIAHTADFCVLKLEGHALPEHLDQGKILAKGTARSVTFAFDEKGKQQVTCQGVQVRLNQGLPK